ncbi:MAG: hypothetical protein PHT77_10350, partial [Bacteroidales bacterium]|nr:hypothetical protein [Bacteroidales bacterium]
MIIAVMGNAQAAGISAVQIDDTIYQFTITETYLEPIRWSFGDGSTSTNTTPVHEFGNGLYDVMAEDGAGKVWNCQIDTRLIVMDAENATVEVGGNMFYGGVLLAGGIGMCWLAGTNQHIAVNALGRWKGLLILLYVIMIVVGGVLV